MNFSSTTLTARVLLAEPIAVLAGRDPGVHIALEKAFNGTSITAALKKRVVPVRRSETRLGSDAWEWAA